MRRLAVLVLSLSVALGLVAPAALAEPRGYETEQAQAAGDVAAPQAARSGPISDPPVETNVNLPPGLIPYHEIAARLRDLDARSDRVSVEVFGQSAGGRDLYLVTVADPRAGNLQADLAFRRLMTASPRAARRLAEANPRLRSPLWVNGSIHGNEWEGVDASIGLIERLAFADDPETLAVLGEHVLLFNVVQNPDGRVAGTRANANGFDLNRDFATLSQPETRAVVRQFVKWHPAALDDLHGYVNPMLIEPTTAPHNPNYEYDLYLRHALPRGRAMEANLLAETGLPAEIPFEDYPRGEWDDWPPIFTPQQAQYHGAIASTLESPLAPTPTLPADERARRAAVNRSAHIAAVWGGWRYLTDNAQAVMLDQIEIFRRGVDQERPVSQPFVELGDDLGYPSPPGYEADPPRAYVIPAGSGQRSEVAAARLVNHLRFSGVEVRRAALPFRAGGTLYPGGSYVVDMGQALRGLANSYLEPGYDLTPVTPQMYDISGWSHSELWGATVVPVETSLSLRGLPLLADVSAATNLRPGAAAYAIEPSDPAAVRAVNALLDAGVALVRLPDGRVVVPEEAYADLNKVVEVEGVRVARLDAVPSGGEPLQRVRVIAAAAPQEVFALREMGYEVQTVSAPTLAATLDPATSDVLYVSTGLTWANLAPEAQAAVRAFLAAGGGLVTRGASGANFNLGAGVLDVAFTSVPPGTATPNGVARVTHASGSPIMSGYPAADTTFIESPIWFTRLGTGVLADERFGDGDFFFAGHWIGQEAAAGQPSVVSGVDETSARSVLFGTYPLFRAHPKKLYGQVAQALYWTSVP